MTAPFGSARLWTYASTALAAPFIALALGDPAPVLVALPGLLLVVVGLVTEVDREVRIECSLAASTTHEGGRIPLRIEVGGPGSVAHVRLSVPPGLTVEAVDGGRHLGGGDVEIPMRRGSAEATLSLAGNRWGRYRLGAAVATTAGPLRMRFGRGEAEASESLVVLPGFEKVRRLVEPLATNMHAGDVVSRSRGSGLELAELRTWAPGDPRRSINWRASARSDRLWVSDRHADRNGDLVIVMDSVVAPGTDVEAAVRHGAKVAAGIVAAYGRAGQRLGLVSLGGRVRWFGLGAGPSQHHRLLEALLDVTASASPVWMAFDRVLARAVRPPSMVVFVTPLLDDGVVGRIRRLALAGMDVAVVGVDPSGWIRPGPGEVSDLAFRIWRLERQAMLGEFAALGVGVGEWRPGRALSETLEEVEAWRHRRRRARA